MSSEKMMILKMLEERKIDANEAARLLSAADGDTRPAANQAPPPGKPPAARPDTAPRSYGSQKPPSHGRDDFTSDLSRKFETLARDIEPKLYKLTETVADATGKVADKISKTLSSPASARPPSPAPVKTGSANLAERSFEATVTPGYNELNFSGLNADVLIKGYNGDKISARILYKSKKPNAAIEIMKLGSKYFLNYEEDDFETVSIDAFIPGAMFNNVVLATVNAAINVSAVESDYLSVSNLNGAACVSDCACQNIKVDCSNGALKLENLKGRIAKIENFNGGIYAARIDTENLALTALNGSLAMNIADFTAYSDYTWNIETSNSKMTLNLPSSPEYGYHLKALATFADIKIGLTGLNYITNSPASVEAQSINYGAALKHIKMSLETSNGPLTVN